MVISHGIHAWLTGGGENLTFTRSSECRHSGGIRKVMKSLSFTTYMSESVEQIGGISMEHWTMLTVTPQASQIQAYRSIPVMRVG